MASSVNQLKMIFLAIYCDQFCKSWKKQETHTHFRIMNKEGIRSHLSVPLSAERLRKRAFVRDFKVARSDCCNFN